MKFINHLLPYLVFVTLFLISEAWSPGSNSAGSRPSTSRTQASGQNQPSRTSTWHQIKASETSTLNPPQPSRTAWGQIPSAATSGHQPPTNKDFPPLQPRQQSYAGNGHNLPQKSSTLSSTESTSTTNNRSKTSEIQISTASVEACVDDTSPAESCFDYFTLAIIWSPGYAYKQSLLRKRTREKITPNWIIHGLWPSMYSRNDIIPPRCNRTDMYFNPTRLNTNGLQMKLDNYWYTILSPGSVTNTKFWEHEFKKHGNCATRSTSIVNGFNYFSKTVELFENLEIGTILANQKYRPGTTEKLGFIIKTIEEKLGAKVIVDFTTNSQNKGINYLSEVFICYNIELTRIINCPNIGGRDNNNSLLDKDITYLNEILTSRTNSPN